ncbi:sensor histidine kinase [Natronosporangium hydrolyticum]|uniref:histidine kinase n=1 Tax=Natronosporangium hydrolyticum TaxID=2811111 RepID=A0A895YEX2_9ACTN|nr:sensor histidine kinase [Natronosporangium hydrolyticum]QSB13086.1 sensor histidine kinase [Natronosporangium hydrolyticum]
MGSACAGGSKRPDRPAWPPWAGRSHRLPDDHGKPGDHGVPDRQAHWAGHSHWVGHGPWPGWWGRGRRPAWSPFGLAVVIAAVQVVGCVLAARNQPTELDPVGYALLVVSGLVLALRYRQPLVTFGVAGAATLAYWVGEYPNGPSFVALIIAGVAAVKAGRRYPVWALTGVGYAGWALLTGPGLRHALVIAAWTVGLAAAAEWARAGTMHRARAVQVQQERARAAAEQQRRHASEERLRIAQELHDVIGHHLSLINVQAGVGLHLMDNQPEQARRALGTIKQASAEALREVRSVLATLGAESDSAPRTPAPGLARLAELIEPAGIAVATSITGTVRTLPAELDRAAYRIVQEALTNVRRHAGSAASATVRIDYQEDDVVLRIEDDGGANPPLAAVTEGSGISGMRERAAAWGGSLTARPRPAGGFEVVARLPLPAGGER